MATFYDSRVSTFRIGSVGSTDLSAYIKSIDGLPGIRNLNDVTAFGSVGHRWSPGLEDSAFTIEMIYSVDATVGSDTIFGIARTSTAATHFYFCPTGVTTNSYYYGDFWVDDYTVKSLIGQAVMATVKCKADNGVTRT